MFDTSGILKCFLYGLVALHISMGVQDGEDKQHFQRLCKVPHELPGTLEGMRPYGALLNKIIGTLHQAQCMCSKVEPLGTS